jgi:GTP-binding protein
VGKSSLIAKVSAARPKIGDYPFTTIDPNLGLVRLAEEESFVLVDIPGLIEGAGEGAGLGHRFLRHAERTKLLIHVLDIAGSEGRDPLSDFALVQKELAAYSQGLRDKPQILAANKIDLPDGAANLARLREELGERYPIFPLSALTGEGCQSLMLAAAAGLADLAPARSDGLGDEPGYGPADGLGDRIGDSTGDRIGDRIGDRTGDGPEYGPGTGLKITRLRQETGPALRVEGANGRWLLAGYETERQIRRTDFANEAAVNRLLRILRSLDVDQALERAGAKNGDTVLVGPMEFEFFR